MELIARAIAFVAELRNAEDLDVVFSGYFT
jgi:hypothetical protein